MDLDHTSRWSGWLGKAGAVFCILFLMASFDALISRFRQPVNSLELLPGRSVAVNGTLKENIQDIGILSYTSTSDKIWLNFESVHTGFWLGGYMWRGLVVVSSEIEPGEYRLAVDHEGGTYEKPESLFQIKVHENYQSLRENSKSLFRRYLDVSPWLMLAGFFILASLAFGGVFLLSHRKDSLLAEQGRAEIYRVSKTHLGYEIAFALGTRHGVRSDMQLELLDMNAKPVGHARVLEAFESDAVALAETTSEIKQGFMVMRL